MESFDENRDGIVWRIITELVTYSYEYQKDKTASNETKIKTGIKNLTDLVSKEKFHDFDILFSPGESDHNVNTEFITRLTGSLYRYASVPTFEGREDCGFQKSDFIGVSERSYSAISLFTKILDKLSNSYKTRDRNLSNMKPVFCQKMSLYGLLLAGQHSGNDLWNTAEVGEASKRLSDTLVTTMECQSLSELLCEPSANSLVNKGLFQQMMAEIKPRFQKDNWKRNPGIPRIFAWSISFIKSPYMSDQIDLVLPPSLFLVDDHQAEYKVLGITSVCFLMEECSREEVRWCGRGEVIYEALQHQLYSTEAEVLQATLPALIRILEITEGIPQSAAPPRAENRYDTILDRLLQSMEMENTLVLRRIYTKHLPVIMKKMGITLCRHMPTILRVLAYYLEIFDGPTEEARYGALGMLEVLIKATWPRIHTHAGVILRFLLKLVYDLSTDKTTTPDRINERLISKATTCGQLLRMTNPEKVDSLLCDVPQIDFNDSCAKFGREIAEGILNDQ